MDFGVQVGLDGLVGSDTSNSGFASLASSDPEAKQRLYGSGFFKQERPGNIDGDWRISKLSKTESMLLEQSNASFLKSSSNSLFSNGQQQQQQQQQQMLSFSCPKPAPSVEKSSQNGTLPYFHLTSSAHNRNTGYSSGIFNAASMHGVLTETRWPFTQSQWMELEHQALIYKYIAANVPIPSNLLIPIRKALDSSGFPSFSAGFFRHNTLPWGAFHMGFSSNTDPEPGRCRRTDGKKWRCARDAVTDQKYCERHMNRGRHRSRKPVEGQSGHSAATTTTVKPANGTSSSTSATVVGLRSAVSDSLTIAHNQQQGASPSNLSASNTLSRMFLAKESGGERTRDASALSMLRSNIDLKSKETPFFISKQQDSYGESLRNEFGLVTSDSLLNHSQRSSSLMSCRNFGSSQDLTDQESVSQHSLRQFMDDWPKSQSDRSAVSWPELDQQSERTQLSISIPMAPADFMSSTSSPNNEKITLSPLRLSREFDPIQMGLGVGGGGLANEPPNQKQANWIPISWGTSMGGPLGEVLHTTNSNAAAECKTTSSLNLMTYRWDNSPRIGSSPTGVLQKSAFASLSNSSAGSSPRAENKANEGGSLCNDLLGSTIVHSSSLPAM